MRLQDANDTDTKCNLVAVILRTLRSEVAKNKASAASLIIILKLDHM